MTSTVSFIDMIHDIQGDSYYHAKRLATSCLPRALMMFQFSFIGKFLKILELNSIAWLLLNEYVACASSDGTVSVLEYKGDSWY